MDIEAALRASRRKVVFLEQQRLSLVAQNKALLKQLSRLQSSSSSSPSSSASPPSSSSPSASPLRLPEAATREYHDTSAPPPGRQHAPVKSKREQQKNQLLEAVQVLQLELDSLQAQQEASASGGASVNGNATRGKPVKGEVVGNVRFSTEHHLARVLRRVREFGSRREELYAQLEVAQNALVDEFEARSEKLRADFVSFEAPYNEALALLRERLVRLLQGQVVKIIAPSELERNRRFQSYLHTRSILPPRRGQRSPVRDAPSVAPQEVQQPQEHPRRSRPRPVASDEAVKRNSSRANASSHTRGQGLGAEFSPVSSPIFHSGSPIRFSSTPLQHVAPSPPVHSSLPEAQVSKEERRRGMANDELMPLFPELSFEHAMSVLEESGDNVHRAMLALYEQDYRSNTGFSAPAKGAGSEEERLPQPRPLASLVAPGSAPSRSEPRHWTAVSSGSYTGASSTGVAAPDVPYSVQQWLATLPRITVVIDEVRDDFGVEARVLFDRNGVPLESGQSTVHVISVFTLIRDLDCTLCCSLDALDAAKPPVSRRSLSRSSPLVALRTQRTSMVPVITFEPTGRDSFRLLSVKPRIPLSQYVVDYNPDTQQIVEVCHADDGPIAFTSYCPNQFRREAKRQAESIHEVYSQVLDDDSVCIGHVDLRGRARDTVKSVRVVYLAPECALAAAAPKARADEAVVVVQNQRVIAVVLKEGVCAAVEHRIAGPGELASLPVQDDENSLCIGVVRGVPGLGAIVASPPGSENEYRSAPPKAQLPASERVSELQVDVLLEGGELLAEPRPVVVPVTEARTALQWEIEVYERCMAVLMKRERQQQGEEFLM